MPLLDHHPFVAELERLYSEASRVPNRTKVGGGGASGSSDTDDSGDESGTKKGGSERRPVGRGSVWVTMKRHYPGQAPGPRKARKALEHDDDTRPVVLVRATNGHRKITSHVTSNEVAKFSDRMSSSITSAVDSTLAEKVGYALPPTATTTATTSTTTPTASASAATAVTPGGGGGGGGTEGDGDQQTTEKPKKSKNRKKKGSNPLTH